MSQPKPAKLVADALRANSARDAVRSIAKSVPLPKHSSMPVEYWPDDKREQHEHALAVRNELVRQLAARFVDLHVQQAGAAWTVTKRTLDGSVQSLRKLDERWLKSPIASFYKPAFLDSEMSVVLGAYAFEAVRKVHRRAADFELRNDLTESRITFAYSTQLIEPWAYVDHVVKAGFPVAALAERVKDIVKRIG